jgi:hypothetical protein
MQKAIIWILVALILAGSMLGVAMIFSDTAITIKNKGYVTVKGYAKQHIKSDLGIFEVDIIVEEPDLKQCYKMLTQNKSEVQTFLDNNGVTADEVEYMPVEISEKYKINERGFDTDVFVAYRLKQKFRVKSMEVQKIVRVSDKIADVLDKGVMLSVKDPKYIYTKLEGLKVEMIGRATDNASERAKIIAKEGKFKLGPIASVRVGVFQITPLFSTRVSDYGVNDTSSIDKEIKSLVEIRYFVK